MLLSDPSKTFKTALELQTCFACRVRQGLDAPVIEITAAIEDHLLDSLFQCTLRYQLAHFLGRRHVATSLQLGGESGGGKDGFALGVINDLCINVVQRTVYVQPRAHCGAFHLLADAKVHALANYVSLSNREHLVLSFLKAELPCNSVRFTRLTWRRSCQPSSSSARPHSGRLCSCTGPAYAASAC